MQTQTFHFHGTRIDRKTLGNMTGSALVKLYNEVSDELGYTHVRRFANKANAVQRVVGRLELYAAQQPAVVKDKSGNGHDPTERNKKKKPARRARGMRFLFRPEDEIRVCRGKLSSSRSGDTRTLRQRAVDLLSGQGATFEQVKKMVVLFDKDRGVETDHQHVERRAYELVRLLHYYLGYGIKQEGDQIIAYTNAKDAPPAVSETL